MNKSGIVRVFSQYENFIDYCLLLAFEKIVKKEYNIKFFDFFENLVPFSLTYPSYKAYIQYTLHNSVFIIVANTVEEIMDIYRNEIAGINSFIKNIGIFYRISCDEMKLFNGLEQYVSRLYSSYSREFLSKFFSNTFMKDNNLVENLYLEKVVIQDNPCIFTAMALMGYDKAMQINKKYIKFLEKNGYKREENVSIMKYEYNEREIKEKMLDILYTEIDIEKFLERVSTII